MKINSSTSPILLRANSAPSARPMGNEPARAPSRDRSALSSSGALVGELRDTARAEGRFGGIRSDVVAGIKKEMAEGRFGGSADVEKAIDALLMEL